MSEVFLKIINMSISASWFVLAVLLLRLVLKKAPKWVSVLLWGLVAVRLLCPFSFESVLSLIPSAETISPEIMTDPSPEIHTGIGSLNSVINPIISESFAPDPLVSMNPLQLWIPLAAVTWIIGIAAMLIYTAVSYWLLRRKVNTAVLLRDNILQSENVDSPFVLGIIKPKIYLPFQLDGQNLEHVVAHERAHIRRKDHWWKPLGFLLLTIHWFNPLMWLAYILLCRDIELACDEKVIQEMDNESRADYSQALVACSINRRSIAACPLAFGEVGVKERVKSVMNYKKPAFWIIIAAIAICVAVAVCFLTNPKDSSAGALPNIHSHTYVVEEVTYESGMHSFTVVAGKNSPVYAITEDMSLSSQKEHSDAGVWTQLGKLEEAKLTKENFDDLFYTDGWNSNANVKNIRKNTVNAWQLIYNQEILYYILQQKNGDLYLAYGYYDYYEKDDPFSDDTSIRWLYKLAIDANGTSGMIVKSGESTVPMVSFPAGTAIADYVDSLYWLTINPGEEALVPFTTWKDGKEVRGFYNAFDAETFEPIEYFVPSGLDPQTYLFQNADPSRAYIVLATFSMDADAEVYAFGARFDSSVSSVGGADDSSVTVQWDNTQIPERSDKVETISEAITKAIIEQNAGDRFVDTPSGLLNVESHYIFASESKSGTPMVDQTNHMEETTVYLLYVYMRYYHSGGRLEDRASVCTPAAITFSTDPEQGFTVKEFWEPHPGNTYTEEVRSKFPKDTAEVILDTRAAAIYANELQSRCLSKAEGYLAEAAGTLATSGMPVAWICGPVGEASTSFRFQFDIPYTKIAASCDHGSLVDADSITNKKIDTVLTLGEGRALYWSASLNGDFYKETKITFTLYDGEKETYSGIITLLGKSFNNTDTVAYVATLDCSGLRLDVNDQAIGAMISLVAE